MDNVILQFLITRWWILLIAIAAVIMLIKLVPRYKIAPPDTALIISGLMRRNYKVRNADGSVTNLLGVSIDKHFMPSVANVIGTDLTKYKVVRRNRFACSLMQVSRDHKMPISRYDEDIPSIISPAYVMFELTSDDVLPEYLELWTQRAEFDREADFYAVGGVRGNMTWDELQGMSLVVPPIEEQRAIVARHRAIDSRINALRQLNDKLAAWRKHVFEHQFGQYKAGCLEGKSINGWSRVQLGNLADFTYGKMVPASKRTERGVPVYSGYGITGYCKEAMFTESQLIVVARGVSGTGNVRITPEKCYLTNLSIAVLLYDRTDMGYLFEYLSGDNLISLDSGSAQSMITIGDLSARHIALPPKEQVKKFNEIFQPIKRMMDANESEIEILARAKSAYVTALGR